MALSMRTRLIRAADKMFEPFVPLTWHDEESRWWGAPVVTTRQEFQAVLGCCDPKELVRAHSAGYEESVWFLLLCAELTKEM